MNIGIKTAIAILFAVISHCLTGQTLTVYKIPHLPAGTDKAASVAANPSGDILVVYANTVYGAVSYFKRHDRTTWSGPAAIPGQTYSNTIKSEIYWTDTASATDDRFHAVWAVNSHLAEPYGMYYAVFDPEGETWTPVQKLLAGKIGEPKLTTNWVTGDLILVWDDNKDLDKDVYFMVLGKKGWSDPKNLSDATDIASLRPKPQSAVTVMAPHGNEAQTNIFASVDEYDGYVYMTWKEDQHVDDELYGDDWELRIRTALFDPSYNMLWHAQMTQDYRGFHMLPTIAALNGSGLMAFAWMQEVTYNYVMVNRSGGTLEYDPEALADSWLAVIPTIPNYCYFNHLLVHGNDILFTYVDLWRRPKMMRLVEGVWQQSYLNPIDLSGGYYLGNWPFDSWAAAGVGILSAFQNNDDNPQIIVTLYNDPGSAVRSALNVKTSLFTERSFFSKYSFYQISWDDNPANSNQKVDISEYRIYRKLKYEGNAQYRKIGTVPSGTRIFNDPSPVSSQSSYDYFVTCVDNKGNESKLGT